jgi:hypothetical protein
METQIKNREFSTMATPPRAATPTVGFIDQYCHSYRSLFEDVRHFEAFKFLHLEMVSEIPRKSFKRDRAL